MNLDEKDRRILYELDSNARLSATQVAKRSLLRKETVAFRMRKLDCVKKYYAVCDSSLLGYTNYKIYIRFQNADSTTIEKFHSYAMKIPQVSWIAYCNGRFDAAVAVWAKNTVEFNDIVFSLLTKFSSFVGSKEIVANARWFVCNRKWLKHQYSARCIEFSGGRQINLDSTDAKIISVLNKDARARIIDIARHAKVSSPVVIQRIRKMQEDGYIKLFTYDFDLEKIGMEFGKVLMTLQNASVEKAGALLNYCKRHPHIRSIIHSVGPWDLELELEVNNFRHLSAIVSEMRTKFPIIKGAEVLMFTEQYAKNFVPGK